IELDVRLTKDNVPVISHDASINRASNGKGYIHHLTVDQLKKYDFGSSFSKKFKGETIPTLEEALAVIQSSSVSLNIEIKNGPIIPENLEQNILEVVYKYGFEKRVVFSSFDHLSLQRLHKIDPQAKIGLLFHINLIDLFTYIENTKLPI